MSEQVARLANQVLSQLSYRPEVQRQPSLTALSRVSKVKKMEGAKAPKDLRADSEVLLTVRVGATEASRVPRAQRR
jgi:hypothetical protein